MPIRTITAFSVLLTLLVASASADAPAPPSAEAFYLRALTQMHRVAQPVNADYVATVDTTGSTFLLTRAADGSAVVSLEIGGGQGLAHSAVPVIYRGSDQVTALQTKDGQYALTRMPIFDATWSGIDSWIRYGFDGKPQAPSQPTIDPETHLPVIAVVSSLGVANYRVEDEGAAMCESGDPGHMLHLVARRDPDKHPLTDATVNLRTGRFCMLRFAARGMSGLISASGTIELHLATVGSYDLVHTARFDFVIRAMGIAMKRASATATYSGFAFPATVDPAVFSKR